MVDGWEGLVWKLFSTIVTMIEKRSRLALLAAAATTANADIYRYHLDLGV